MLLDPPAGGLHSCLRHPRVAGGQLERRSPGAGPWSSEPPHPTLSRSAMPPWASASSPETRTSSAPPICGGKGKSKVLSPGAWPSQNHAQHCAVSILAPARAQLEVLASPVHLPLLPSPSSLPLLLPPSPSSPPEGVPGQEVRGELSPGPGNRLPQGPGLSAGQDSGWSVDADTHQGRACTHCTHHTHTAHTRTHTYTPHP